MYSVTQYVNNIIEQPRGGYLNKKLWSKQELKDGVTLNEKENIHGSLIGLATKEEE